MKRIAALFSLLWIAIAATVAGGFAASAATAEGQVWWGYWNSSQPLLPQATLPQGTSSCAIRVLASSQPLLVGGQLHGLRFYLGDKTAVTSAKVWVASRLDGTYLLEQDVPLSQLRDHIHDGQPTEVSFGQAIDVLPAQNAYANFYAGFTVTVGSGANCQLMASGSDHAAANSNLFNGTPIESTYGPLAMQLLVSGPRLQPSALAVTSPLRLTALAGSEAEWAFTVTMEGTKPVSTLSYEVSVDGQQLVQRELTLTQPLTELGQPLTLTTTLPLPATASQYALTTTVATIDGQSNTSGSPAAQATLLALDQAATKRTVMEEFTGTWCPNCVRGITGIELLRQEFGQSFIPIAVHSGDPMEVKDYATSPIKRRAGSALPACSVDRLVDCDPYLGNNLFERRFQTNDIIRQRLAETATADIDVTAHWTDATCTAISVDVATTYRYSSPQPPSHQLALVVVADSLCGDGKDWLQINGLAGDDTWGDDLKEFTAGERNLAMSYDHVAIAAAGIANGLEASIAAPIVCSQPQHYGYTFDMSNNKLVQDKARLSVVAMLIDTKSGVVLNAAQGGVTGSDLNGVVAPTANEPDAQRAIFDLAGRRVAQPSKESLVIVRSTDGQVRKQIMRNR